MLKIYNTLTDKKEALKKPRTRPLKLFVCGPTVYDYPHLGNFRTYLNFDIIVRYLRSQGYDIFYLQNITDVDDKIIAKAEQEGSTWEKIARHFEELYLKTGKELGLTSVNKFARATDYIPQIVHQVKTLIKKNHVYQIEGDGWYFDLRTSPDYGKLARRTIEQADDGVTRIDVSERKRNTGDFCVWKFSKPGEPMWQTELGNGRPGWHIEDTAITEHFFGPQYDLHGGGIDLKFPHHEAEIAQQEAASGKKPFVKIWMHAGLLNVRGRKMSKSLGNFVTMEEILKHYSPAAFRLLTLQHHYRAPMDYSEEAMQGAEKNLMSLSAFIKKLTIVISLANKTSVRGVRASDYEEAFHASMQDDFNTPKAIAVFFTLMKEIHPNIWKLSSKQAEELKAFIEASTSALGLTLPAHEAPAKVQALADRRELFRRNKQFTQADELRHEIELLGYVVEDTPKGPIVLPRENE